MDLLQFQQNLLSIDAWDVLQPILIKHLDKIEELNRSQLSKGLRGDGSAMPDYKSNSYADFKSKYVHTYEIYPTTDLRYTGSFYEKIQAKMVLMGIEIESLDSKASSLERKYSKTIHQLTDQSMELWLEPIMPEFINNLHLAMFKN